MTNTYKCGDKDIRPWGIWEILSVGANFCVKKICVKPHSKLSLQLHYHRSEHWIIVKGKAKITLGDEKFLKKENESIFIPLKTIHRIENDTDENVEFIEVQIGEILDENDIVRIEDAYDRV